MKTLFGERKSVKALAFILALALILPLLPVMSVVGATFAQITFKSLYDDENPYRIINSDGDVLWYDETGEHIIRFGSYSFTVAKGSGSGNDKDFVLTPKGAKGPLKFYVDTVETGYAVYVKDNSSDKKEIIKNADGSYTIPHNNWTNGNLTVTIEKAYTVKLPSAIEAASGGYTITTGEQTLTYGSQTVSSSSNNFSFSVNVDESGMVPRVLAVGSDGSRKELTKEGTSQGNKFDYVLQGIDKNFDIIIELRDALSISYQATSGTATDSFTITGNVDLYSAPYNTSNFKFTVNAADGYDLQDVILNGKSVVDEGDSKTNTKTKTCTINDAITKNITIYVTTKAVKPTVEVKASSGELIKNVTVTGYPSSVNYDGTVTFTVTPDRGYIVPAVTYTIAGDGSRENQPVSPNENGVYTIQNVTGNLTITIGDATKQKFDVTAPVAGTVDGAQEIMVQADGKSLSGKAEHGAKLTVKVTPEDYYSVTSVTFTNKDTGATLVSTKSSVETESGAVTYTLDEVSSNIVIDVVCSPITVTVTFKNGPTNYPTSVTLVGSAIKEWLFEANEDGKTVGAFNPAKFNEYQGTAPYRYGVDFVEFTAGNEALDKHLDCTIELTAKWKVNVDEYFVLTTVPTYGNKMITFTTKLSVNENVEQSTQDIVGRDYTISKYGLFYGENGMTLSEGDRNACNTYLNSNKESLKEGFVNAITDVESGRVYLFGYAGTGMRFTVYTHKVSGVQNGSGRSAIAFYIISLGGQEYTIIGQATSITYSLAE